MAGLFFDTNVLLYAARPRLAGAEAMKRRIALGLIGENDFKISAQVLAEFYHNAIKPGPHALPTNEADMWLDHLANQPCIAIDHNIVKHGAALAARYKISYWDGAILAAAHEADTDLLYTEDLNDGQTYGRVTAINPFTSAEH